MSDRTVILSASDLSFSIQGKKLIDSLSLDILKGELLSLVGPNGAGKSTLLMLLSSMNRPISGSIVFNGRRIDTGSAVFAYRRKLGMVFQKPLLFDTTVAGNVAAGLNVRGIEKTRLTRTVDHWLGVFGIAHLAHRPARTLSGGEAQRTSLARALATEPEILFLDEPFTFLDTPVKESIITDLERTIRSTGTTVVCATHDRNEALRLSDRIAVINAGKLVQTGATAEIMNAPADEFTASFLGMETVINAVAKDIFAGSFTAAAGDAAIEAAGSAKPGQEVILCIHPENVVLANSRPSDTLSSRNIFSGTIIKIAPFGTFYKVYIDCGFTVTSWLTPNALTALSLKTGGTVFVSFKATAVHVIKKQS